MSRQSSRRGFLGLVATAVTGVGTGCLGNPPEPKKIGVRVEGLEPSNGVFTDFKVIDTRYTGFTNVSAQCQIWLKPHPEARRVQILEPKSNDTGNESGFNTTMNRPYKTVMRFWRQVGQPGFYRIQVVDDEDTVLDRITVWLSMPGKKPEK